ncbi:hypothetical protein CYY_001480 [Polysphondylium violaceum]|uniref:Uncharacterized protein n=1 Tax=Polysphondylium violaceum TaxID=133409 RepID=A0A8J4Q025_9MYCE|nr:hypothetical protein CYY_001480 [Polysphondylium violaceum]
MSYKNIRCVLVWLDGAFSSFNEKELYRDLDLSFINTLVGNGCAGRLLTLPNEGDNNEKTCFTSQQLFNQILGFESNITLTNDLFKEQYSQLVLKLFSNNNDIELKGGNENRGVIDENTTPQQLFNFVESEYQKAKNCNDIITVVHIKPKSESINDRRDSLLFLNSFFKILLESREKDAHDYYINLVCSYNRGSVDIATTTHSIPIPSTFNLPKPSTQFLNGKEVNPNKQSPLFAIYNHPILTRKDETEVFNEEELLKGSNGSILLIQYLKELAFKLNKVPKYGA